MYIVMSQNQIKIHWSVQNAEKFLKESVQYLYSELNLLLPHMNILTFCTFSSSCLLQSYMEDHLKNKDRLAKEWEALCAYQAEPNATTTGLKNGSAKKNRSTAVVACEYSSNMSLFYFLFDKLQYKSVKFPLFLSTLQWRG